MQTGKKSEEKPEVKTVKCPGCDVRLPANDLRAQMAHMDANHPDIIAQRRRAAARL